MRPDIIVDWRTWGRASPSERSPSSRLFSTNAAQPHTPSTSHSRSCSGSKSTRRRARTMSHSRLRRSWRRSGRKRIAASAPLRRIAPYATKTSQSKRAAESQGRRQARDAKRFRASADSHVVICVDMNRDPLESTTDACAGNTQTSVELELREMAAALKRLAVTGQEHAALLVEGQ